MPAHILVTVLASNSLLHRSIDGDIEGLNGPRGVWGQLRKRKPKLLDLGKDILREMSREIVECHYGLTTELCRNALLQILGKERAVDVGLVVLAQHHVSQWGDFFDYPIRGGLS